jgi:hypothetical protein
VPVDQAIFTSLERRNRSGYHLVARSPGVSGSEASELERWCPSHGGLIVDAGNRVSVNFQPLVSGRFALSRTCEGRPEYSGRGGRQVYTHALLFDVERLRLAGDRPFLIYRDALALGHLHYRAEPGTTLPQVALSSYYPKRESDSSSSTARALGVPVLDRLLNQLNAGQSVVVPFAGDRTKLAESLITSMEPEALYTLSFATSLHPSAVRPYRLSLVPPAG